MRAVGKNDQKQAMSIESNESVIGVATIVMWGKPVLHSGGSYAAWIGSQLSVY